MEQAIKNKKICFAASSGGHLEQLMMLKPLLDRYEGYVVTESTDYHVELNMGHVYYLRQINRRELLFPIKLIVNIVNSLHIFLKEMPDIVICTGALATVPTCLIAKLFGKKLIFIESFAKISSPTITGRWMYRIADRFYVQWEEMLKFYPKAVFLGGIY